MDKYRYRWNTSHVVRSCISAKDIEKRILLGFRSCAIVQALAGPFRDLLAKCAWDIEYIITISS